MLYDAAHLLLEAGEISGHVLEGHYRDVEGVAYADEAGCLAGCVDIETSRHEKGLIGDDAYRISADAGEARDHVAGVEGLRLEEFPAIYDAFYDIAHVVTLVGVGRHYGTQQDVGPRRVVTGLLEWGLLQVVARKVG